MEELEQRLKRLYAMIGRVKIVNSSEPEPKYRVSDSGVEVWSWSFSGEGVDQQELLQDIHNVIHLIATFRDNLEGWLDENGYDPKLAIDTVKNSEDLKIIHDLDNTDKHRKLKKDKKRGTYGRTNRRPKLGPARRALVLSRRRIEVSKDGSAAPMGGTAQITTAPVYDDKGVLMGDCMEIAERAVSVWESVLVKLSL